MPQVPNDQSQTSIMKPSENNQPQKPDTLLLIEEGDMLQSSNDFYGAIDAYSLDIKKDPSNALAYHHKRGWAKVLTGDIKGEIEDWTKAIEINPQFDTAYADMAVGRVTLRDYKGAEEDAKTAIQLNSELKKKLEPILNNISKALETQNFASSFIEKKTDDSEELIDLGNDRRGFLKNAALMGVATVAVSLTGCTINKLAGGKKV